MEPPYTLLMVARTMEPLHIPYPWWVPHTYPTAATVSDGPLDPPYPTLPYPTILYSTLPFSTLPYPTLPYPVGKPGSVGSSAKNDMTASVWAWFKVGFSRLNVRLMWPKTGYTFSISHRYV